MPVYTPMSPVESRYRDLAEAFTSKGLNPQITAGGYGGFAQGLAGLAQAFAGRRLNQKADAERGKSIQSTLGQIDTLGLDPKYSNLVKMLTQQDPSAGLGLAAQIATAPAAETWKTLSDDDERAAGLPTGGIYQQSTKGDLKVLKGDDTLSPGALAQKLQLAQAGRANTTVTLKTTPDYQVGDIPKDFMLVPDGKGGVAMKVIPGSATDLAQQSKGGQKAQTADIVTGKVDEAIKIMDEATLPTTGFGSWLQNTPTTAANDLRATVDTIKANSAFDTLQKMRESSPTGGALGSVSAPELNLLQSALASLDQSQSEKQFRQNLQQVREIYGKIINGDPDRILNSGPAGGKAAAPSASGQTDYSKMSDQEILDGLRKKGLLK